MLMSGITMITVTIRYLQAHRLALYSFMDAGRSQNSWIKDKKSRLPVNTDHSEFYVFISIFSIRDCQ